MKISTKGEYGIRALLYLAMRPDPEPVPSHEIASRQAVPEAYLRQILSALARDGLVQSSRGPQGGHALARPAADITLRDVLVCLEGQTTSVDDILSLPCAIEIGTDHCAIREVLLAVREAVDRVLSGVSLETLAERQRQILDGGIQVPRDAAGRACLPVLAD